VIPVAFDYARPSTVEDAVAALAGAGDDAKVLAGGQSLLPVLRLRLAAPTVVVDLGAIASLRGIRVDGDDLVVGAMATHAEVASSPLVQTEAPLVAVTAITVGDRQVRHRGTLGGSLAHADPAGDLPAAAVALDATIVLVGPAGRRSVAARDFFTDIFTTSMEPGEILVEVRFPRTAGWTARYEKFHRTAQAWALVGVAATVRRENGAIAEARVAFTNLGSTPIRASAVEAALAGAADLGTVKAAAAHAAEAMSPPSPSLSVGDGQVGNSVEYRRHLAGVLTARAVASAAGLASP
jgi:carbon-monoxide dehydrogenase medium subunit